MVFLLKSKKNRKWSRHNPQWWSFLQVSVAGSGTGRGSPAVTLVQLPSGQTVHVQGIIQTPQPSVIQSPQIQTVQVSFLPRWFAFDFLQCFFFLLLIHLSFLYSFYAHVFLLEIWRNFLFLCEVHCALLDT